MPDRDFSDRIEVVREPRSNGALVDSLSRFEYFSAAPVERDWSSLYANLGIGRTNRMFSSLMDGVGNERECLNLPSTTKPNA